LRILRKQALGLHVLPESARVALQLQNRSPEKAATGVYLQNFSHGALPTPEQIESISDTVYSRYPLAEAIDACDDGYGG
jgi:hypothetical protein